MARWPLNEWCEKLISRFKTNDYFFEGPKLPSKLVLKVIATSAARSMCCFILAMASKRHFDPAILSTVNLILRYVLRAIIVTQHIWSTLLLYRENFQLWFYNSNHFRMYSQSCNKYLASIYSQIFYWGE